MFVFRFSVLVAVRVLLRDGVMKERTRVEQWKGEGMIRRFIVA